MNDLDAQAQLLLYPFLAPTPVTRIYPQMRKVWKVITCGLQHQLDAVLVGDLLGAADLGF